MEIVKFLLGMCSKFLAILGITGGFLYFISALSQSTPSITLLCVLLTACVIETGRETYEEIIESERIFNGFR